MQNKNNLAYFILILTTIFWSGNFIVGKAASTYDIPPFSLNFYRWFFAGLILFPFTIKELIAKKEYILDRYKLVSKNNNLPDDKKLDFDIWVNPKNNLIYKVSYNRAGKWEYRLKDFEIN